MLRGTKMAENSKKLPRGKPFKKGRTGNPGGRPKRTPEEFELIQACKDKTPAALAVMVKLMSNASSDAVKLNAATAVIERGYGKPTTVIEATVTSHEATLDDLR